MIVKEKAEKRIEIPDEMTYGKKIHRESEDNCNVCAEYTVYCSPDSPPQPPNGFFNKMSTTKDGRSSTMFERGTSDDEESPLQNNYIIVSAEIFYPLKS